MALANVSEQLLKEKQNSLSDFGLEDGSNG